MAPRSTPPPRAKVPLRGHERTNLALWEASAADYERRNARTLSRGSAMGWGMWHVPESELQVLGEVRGKDILELGCGAARWSVALAERGARMVGLDFSATRLAQARAHMAAARVEFPLVEASAESVPLPSARFDIVFCDWGAATFTDPYRTVREVARLLRPSGLFAFSNSSPFRSLCQHRTTDRISARLLYDYFDLHRIVYPDEVNFQLAYGAWIRLFRTHGFVVEDLIEMRPPRGARTTYLSTADAAWARHWPMEVIWRVRRSDAPRTAPSPRRTTRARPKAGSRPPKRRRRA
jgi:ubiquinone/menaquinone biosynthesis C-methylase UbiE